MMKKNEEISTRTEAGIPSAADRRTRRRLLKAGAVLIPTIVTLRATPAWAGNDYTLVAYRYGAGVGMCKNAHFDANAPKDSDRAKKYVPCP